MLDRRRLANSVAHAAVGSAFDRLTLHAFMLTVTVAAAAILSYGPAAAMHHIIDVLASGGDVTISAAVAWGDPIAF